MKDISFSATKPRLWNLPLTYQPKIEPVRKGECTQTIRVCNIGKSGDLIRKNVGDLVRYYIWKGKPYRSKREMITAYMPLIKVINITILPKGIIATFDRDDLELPENCFCRCTLWLWNELDFLAALDFIVPPTGEALRDVLMEKNKIPESGVEAQILRWKWQP